MKRKVIGIILGIVMVFSLVGCADSNKPMDDIDEEEIGEENIENPENDNNEEENHNNDEEEEEESPPDIEEITEEEVTLYFANKEYIETGNESLERLIGEKRTINFENSSLEKAIIEELQKGPESHELETVIPETITILDVEISNGTAFVNFDKAGLSGGSMQEDFTLTQIMDSLFELDHIEKVQFLINGEKAESLMGHFEILEPFEDEGK